MKQFLFLTEFLKVLLLAQINLKNKPETNIKLK